MTAEEKDLGIIAGKGIYPLELAKAARAQGVPRLYAVAFRGETEPAIDKLVDQVTWMRVGQLTPFLEAWKQSGVQQAVMAGQISPRNLFHVRLDKAMRALLTQLDKRNADTIFGAISDRLHDIGVDLKPASLFMESCMPAAGPLSARLLSGEEQKDMALGLRIAKTTSGLNIGQTVVIKQGTVLAVEAFEGTDRAILRAGKLGGRGAVVVKVARRGHDMRFDIPVIGEQTLRAMKKAGAVVLAVEAERTILLDRPRLAGLADKWGIGMTAVHVEEQDV